MGFNFNSNSYTRPEATILDSITLQNIVVKQEAKISSLQEASLATAPHPLGPRIPQPPGQGTPLHAPVVLCEEGIPPYHVYSSNPGLSIVPSEKSRNSPKHWGYRVPARVCPISCVRSTFSGERFYSSPSQQNYNVGGAGNFRFFSHHILKRKLFIGEINFNILLGPIHPKFHFNV